MLGRFLELSIEAPDIRASLDFYSKLGFFEAAVGDTWPHPYAVVTDGRICIGLHQTNLPAPMMMTFVKPELRKHLDAFEAQGARFEFRHLGDEVFNEVGWCDPSGHLIRIVEARTFSPIDAAPLGVAPGCGYFAEVALPTTSLEASCHFWEKFGFVALGESALPLPHVCCTSDTLDVGLYPTRDIPRPYLLFDSDGVEASLQRLAAQGIEPLANLSAALRSQAANVLLAPEGTPILLASGLA